MTQTLKREQQINNNGKCEQVTQNMHNNYGEVGVQRRTDGTSSSVDQILTVLNSGTPEWERTRCFSVHPMETSFTRSADQAVWHQHPTVLHEECWKKDVGVSNTSCLPFHLPQTQHFYLIAEKQNYCGDSNSENNHHMITGCFYY